jgi:uncharacterized damage-inducible protein DinB
MNRSEISLLVDYNYWGRDRVLSAVSTLDAEMLTRDMGNSFRSIRDTLTHVYSAEWIWYSRWQGESPSSGIPLDRFPDITALTAAWQDLEGQIRAYIAAQDDAGLARTMSYRLLNGTPGTSVLWQMIQHVVNHGTYHRGQITTMLRQLGIAPPKSTDLIAFYRERSA